MKSSQYRFIDDADIDVDLRDSFEDVEVEPPHPDGIIWIGLDCSQSAQELYPIIIWHDDGSDLEKQMGRFDDLIGDPWKSYCRTSTPAFYDGQLIRPQSFEFRYSICPISPEPERGITDVSAESAREALYELHEDIETKSTMGKRTTQQGQIVHTTFRVNFLEQPARTRVPFFGYRPDSEEIKEAIKLMHIPVFLLTEREELVSRGPREKTYCSVPSLETDI